MRTPNYSSWELDPAAFDSVAPDQRLPFLVRFAVLAPSSHNSQPWKFAVDGETITVSPDSRRELPASDPTGRQMYISLGCAVENIVIAAEYYGYRPDVSYANMNGVPVMRVHCVGSPLPAEDRAVDHAALVISRRHTNRGEYEPRMPDESFLDWAREAANEHLRFDFVSEEFKKEQLVMMVSDALIAAMDSDAFREELSHYVRPNVTSAETGMPMSGFGMPTPPSFLAPFLVKRINVNKLNRKKDEGVLRHTPVFAVISTKGDNAERWIAAGSAFERIAVEAEKRGIKTAPMAAAIEIGDYPHRLQRLLGTDFRPQVFFRIGYCAVVPPRSPRIAADAVMVSAK